MKTKVISCYESIGLEGDEFSFHIRTTNDKSASLLIRVSEKITIRSLSGNVFFEGYDSGSVEVGSGTYLTIPNIDDTIIIKGKDYILDFELRVGNGSADSFDGFVLKNSRGILLNNCSGIEISSCLNSSTLTSLTMRGRCYGKTYSLRDASLLKEVNVSQTNVSGDVLYLPMNMENLHCYLSDIFGNVEDIKAKAILKTLSCSESMIFVDLSKMSGYNSLESLDCNDGIVEGDISGLSGLSNLTSLKIDNKKYGDRIFGDVGNLPANIHTFSCIKSSILTYKVRKAWSANMRMINVKLMDETSVDNLLDDLSSTSWEAGGTVRITGAKRTSVSDQAVNRLISMGVKVEA